MKQIIINSIDLDKFLTYQNGTLITLFMKEKEIDVVVETTGSKEFKKILSKIKSETDYLRDIKERLDDGSITFDEIKENRTSSFKSGKYQFYYD